MASSLKFKSRGDQQKEKGEEEEEEGDDDDDKLRRGPWTAEEDIALVDYITTNGEGRWNSLAVCAGLKRTGKSCRLRWLNYLRPDVRRGNITLEEQLLILELHSRWGNRWSKIAHHLPGRTDNEIKNYWRTRMQKQAKQLKCDVNSKHFKDTMRYLWMPTLAERIHAEAEAEACTSSSLLLSGVQTIAAESSSSDPSSDVFPSEHLGHYYQDEYHCHYSFPPAEEYSTSDYVRGLFPSGGDSMWGGEDGIQWLMREMLGEGDGL